MHRESQQEVKPVPVYIAPQVGQEEVVSLAGFWMSVFRRKGIVLICLLLSLFFAVGYLFLVKPEYRATAHLLPPQQRSIQGLIISSVDSEFGEIAGLDVEKYTPESVYKAFLHNLKSPGLRREFFVKNDLVHHYANGNPDKEVNIDQVFGDTFNASLQIEVDRQDSMSVSISIIDNDPKFAADYLNRFVRFADERTVNQLFNDVNAAVQAQISKIRQQMASKLKLAEQRRLDSIIVFKEALLISRDLGIEDASVFTKVTGEGQSGLAVNTAQVPLYMRGTRALETNIKVLQSRESDVPFIGGFRDLQERREFLEGISLNKSLLSAVTIDAAARLPYRAESPRPFQIILLAAIVGLLAGIGGALMGDSRA